MCPYHCARSTFTISEIGTPLLEARAKKVNVANMQGSEEYTHIHIESFDKIRVFQEFKPILNIGCRSSKTSRNITGDA